MRTISGRFRRRKAVAARPCARAAAEPLEPRFLLSSAAGGTTTTTTFAVIGDYGFPVGWDQEVANLIHNWSPDYVLTVGDNNYPTGGADTIDYNIGRLYHDYIYHYHGAFGEGSPVSRFLPAIGNHDWGEPLTNADGVGTYTNYFDLPGNERYYDYAAGNVHFFALDSDANEPDGVSADSVQAQWLKSALAAATEPWKIVYFHHPPYSSGFFHGSDMYMRWPFQGWGASAVFTGHDHDYERLDVAGMPYFVDGLGGGPRSTYRQPVSPFSEARYDGGYGAMRVVATDDTLHFEFVNTEGQIVDSYTLGRPGGAAAPPAAPSSLSARGASDARIELSWADNASDETGFEIERSLDGWKYDHLTTVDAGATAWADRGVSPETTYFYRVRAVNAAGPSTFSDAAEARTLTPVPVVPAGSVWKYRDDGSDQGEAWQSPAFDDAGWASGPAELGYGDRDEATTVAFGPSLGNRFVTTYFRRTFEAPADTSNLAELRLRVKADDGAVIYLNGQEVYRSNMPAGPVNYLTRAAHGLKLYEEQEWREAVLPASLLGPGANVLAAEVHQFGRTQFAYDEADLTFDLELTGSRDTAAPVAALAPPPPLIAGATDLVLSVTLSDDQRLRLPPEGSRDLLVSGPNGFSRLATLIGADLSTDGRSLAATYRVLAPGGSWDAVDAGVYTVSTVDDGGMRDDAGNSLLAGPLGTFAWTVPAATISGWVYQDADLNGRPGAAEAGLAGWSMYLDGNVNGRFDPGERMAQTDAGGAYAFSYLAPGDYVVRPVPRAGWKVTAGPVGGGYAVSLASGVNDVGNDFGAARDGAISGYALTDANGDGYFNAGDSFAAGRTVFLDANDNGIPDAGERAVVSAADGSFAFTGLEPGTYVLRELLPAGWRHTMPMMSGPLAMQIGPAEVARFTFLAAAPILASAGGPYAVAEGDDVALSAVDSMAPGMMVRWYEWDFDYDGVTFTADSPRTASPDVVFSTKGAGGIGTSRTVAVRVYDDLGESAVGTTTLHIANVAPTVDAGPDGRRLLGQSFTLAGSFSDPGTDGWTGTVDWGDGGSPQPLPIGADRRFSLNRVYARPGTYVVVVTVADGHGGVGTGRVTVQVAAPGVTGRYVFYNRSFFDGRDPAPTALDDRAVAPDKVALLPGQAATFANVTGYARGINGIMVDLARPPGAAEVTAEDFVFETGSGGGSEWGAAPAPSSVLMLGGAGLDGSDRIAIVWRDVAPRNEWLRVTVRATERTGLQKDDVFYFGNLAGKTFAPADAAAPDVLTVSALDRAAVRQRMFTRAGVASPVDVNRDGRVNALDMTVCRVNNRKTLQLILAPEAAGPTLGAGVAAVGSSPSPTGAAGVVPTRTGVDRATLFLLSWPAGIL